MEATRRTKRQLVAYQQVKNSFERDVYSDGPVREPMPGIVNTDSSIVTGRKHVGAVCTETNMHPLELFTFALSCTITVVAIFAFAVFSSLLFLLVGC